MSVLHVRHIQNHLETHVCPHIVIDDIGGAEKALARHVLSRALSAYAIQLISQAGTQDSCASVTDDTNDNGIDAIFMDPHSSRIFVVQSKWIQSGSGEPDLGDVKKFRDGIADLISLRFDRFGKKVECIKERVTEALNDPSIKMSVVLAYTGIQSLSAPAKRCLEEFIGDLNDANEIVELHVLNQSALHRGLTANLNGDPIRLDVSLSSWGKRQHPHPAWYGQVSATQVAQWWHDHRERLFSKNLRGLLADNEINTDIRNTLLTTPDDFWYFNNGITLIAEQIKRPIAHAVSNEVVTLDCVNVSVVNGAQTVGTVGRHVENPTNSVEGADIQVRIIELGEGGGELGKKVTRSNNRQNRIESRDFVALDEQQIRIQYDLAIEGISYQLLRNADFRPSSTSFDVTESTVSLACATGDGSLAVQLKREIGKLWEDLDKAPYRRLFNQSVSGLYVWRCVKMQRLVDDQISALAASNSISQEARGVLVHGNRLLAALVFGELDKKMLTNIESEFDVPPPWVTAQLENYLRQLTEAIEHQYPRIALPTLFKNASKCLALIGHCRNGDSGPFEQMALSLEMDMIDRIAEDAG